MKRINQSALPLLAFSLVLSGCGNDSNSAKQISELQEKVLKLEAELKEVKAQNAAAIQENANSVKYLTPKVQRLQTDLQKVIKSVSSGESKVTRTTESFNTPEELKQAQDAIAQNADKLSPKHKSMITLIRSYLTSVPMKDIPQKLNERNMLHPDNGSKWDTQKLVRFIELYKIPKGTKPTP